MNLGKTTIFTPGQLRLQALLLLEDNSLVMPLFDYADLVWGDKHNVILMTSLQVLQNKAAKIFLTDLFIHLLRMRLPLLSGRCIYMYKCLNGLVEHDMNFIRRQEQHNYNTTTKLNLSRPSVMRNWASNGLHFMPSRILTPLARQSDTP